MKKILISIIALLLIGFIFYQLNNIKVVKKRIIFIDKFGIITHEDIYTDTIDLKLYTSHGRLKNQNIK
jgi:xanthosine utilization system XapX-like protein